MLVVICQGRLTTGCPGISEVAQGGGGKAKTSSTAQSEHAILAKAAGDQLVLGLPRLECLKRSAY